MALTSIPRRNLMRIWKTRRRMTKSGWVPGAPLVTDAPLGACGTCIMYCSGFAPASPLPYALTHLAPPRPEVTWGRMRTSGPVRTVNPAPTADGPVCPQTTRRPLPPTGLSRARACGVGRAQARTTLGCGSKVSVLCLSFPPIKCRGQTS